MSPSRKTVRICHFSDLHLRPEKPVPPWKLIGKRSLGFANLTLNRGRTHKKEHLVRLIRAVSEEPCDLVTVTGDFTSLALDFEFENIDSLFRENGLSPENTVVIPGNHDRYTFVSDNLNAFETGMAAWLPSSFHRENGYPLVRDLGPVVFVALDTAVWRNPVRAAGVIDETQIDAMKATLAEKRNACWPVIAMHHPPFHRGNDKLRHYRTGLDRYDIFVDALRDRPATVIHGHMHVASRRRVGDLDVIGVPSASNNTGKPATQMAYYVYTFDRTGLKRAESVRLWPGQGDTPSSVERTDLPEEIFAP